MNTEQQNSEQQDDVPSTESDSSAQQNQHHAPSDLETKAGGTHAKHAAEQQSGRSWLLRTVEKSLATVAVAAWILILIGLAQRTGWITADGFQGDGAEKPAEDTGGKPKRYICPMMCTPPSTEPGRCPVCAMKLVEATSGAGAGDGKSVTIETAARRLVGIQTATSKMSSVNRTIRTIGSIEFDESRLSTISAYIDGRLEKMYADYIGVPVREGDDLALIYSPKLFSAQTEFVTSLAGGPLADLDIDGAGLVAMAEENLAELGMTDAQVETLRKTRKPQSRIRIKSPQSGTVIEKSAMEGDYVETGQKLFRIADLSSVWLMLDLFPDDAAAVRFGQQVEAEIQSVRGVVFTGRVAFIDRTVDPRTRTVKVRVEVMNPDGKLRPGDYASARIAVPAVPTDRVYDPALAGKFISPMHPQVIRDQAGPCPVCGMDLVPTSQLGFSPTPLPEQRVVTVPRDAVLLAGDDGVVYVETKPGRFEIRRVTVGPMTEKEAVIIEGLTADETVATSGNFLIDSQMQLAGNPSLMDPSRAASFPPGPLKLPESDPIVLKGDAGAEFDRVFSTYFEIQKALAGDTTAPSSAVSALADGLAKFEAFDEVPVEVQTQFSRARRVAAQLDGPLEPARVAFRTVSHALLRAAVVARGPKTAAALSHYYCPMVPGDGGDWMQPDGDLVNPYWGAKMLHCGRVVADMAVRRK